MKDLKPVLIQYPSYLKNFFKPRTFTSSLRRTHTLSLSPTNGIHSFSYSAAKFCNSLPNSLRKVSDFTEFIRKLLTYKFISYFCGYLLHSRSHYVTTRVRPSVCLYVRMIELVHAALYIT